MEKEIITLTVPNYPPMPEIGHEWEKLNEFVTEFWNTLFIGAISISNDGNNNTYVIPEDYWAPQRIQINKTRLHQNIGVKILSGHHRDNINIPNDKCLVRTVKDLQLLIDAACINRPCRFKVKIIKA